MAAVTAALLAGLAFLAHSGGWRPLGPHAGPLLTLVPDDVDGTALVDLHAVRSAPLLREKAVVRAVASMLDQAASLPWTDTILGDEAAVAFRDGSWLAILRAAGPVHAVRLALVRLAAKASGEGPVITVKTDGGEEVYVARYRDAWILSDDEDLAHEAFECAQGRGAALPSRGDLGKFGDGRTASVWVSENAAPFLIDSVREALEGIAARAADALPEPASSCAVACALDPSEAAGELVVTWPYETEGVRKLVQVKIAADLVQIAQRLTEAAAGAPAPAVPDRPTERVAVTAELSRKGLAGDALRMEVERRLAEARAERARRAVETARDDLVRRTELLRALSRLEGELHARDGDARLRLRVMR